MSSNRRTLNHRLSAPFAAASAVLVLAGCGAEVAGGVAGVGALQAKQTAQARQQQVEVVDSLRAAQDAGAAKTASAAD